MKRVLLFAGCALLLAAASVPARADQNAPELDALFETLQGELEAAEAARVTQRIWDAWIAHDDAAVRALMDAGLHDMRAGRLRAALARFDAMVDLAPDFAEAWNKRATVHYLLGDFAASAADVVETLRLEPRHFGALVGQGLMHMRVRDTAQALIYFRRGLAVNPHMDNVRGYIELLAEAEQGNPI
ncbi:MAG: tetratricopeptide repeat protein [bacterium]